MSYGPSLRFFFWFSQWNISAKLGFFGLRCTSFKHPTSLESANFQFYHTPQAPPSAKPIRDTKGWKPNLAKLTSKTHVGENTKLFQIIQNWNNNCPFLYFLALLGVGWPEERTFFDKKTAYFSIDIMYWKKYLFDQKQHIL